MSMQTCLTRRSFLRAGAFGAAGLAAAPAGALAGVGLPAAPAGAFSVIPAWHLGHFTFSGLLGFFIVIVTVHFGHLMRVGPLAAGALEPARNSAAPGALAGAPAGPLSVMVARHSGQLTLNGLWGFLTVIGSEHLGHLMREGQPGTC